MGLLGFPAKANIVSAEKCLCMHCVILLSKGPNLTFLLSLAVIMATKTKVVLDLNTRVKVIHASERDKLSVKQIMKMFNIGKTQVYEILKPKTEILMWWENCGNG